MLSDKEKSHRRRTRMIQTAKQYTTGTYKTRFVATVFQRMIRAEAAAERPDYYAAMVKGHLVGVHRQVGQCVCVTCGDPGSWSSGLGGMHTGHFLGSRAMSILFEPQNVAVQCARCNTFRGGMPQEYRHWMIHTRGLDAVVRLEMLKVEPRRFSREELVDMRIEFRRRLKEAERAIQGDKA